MQGKSGRARDGPLWHADLGILDPGRYEDLKRTRSDAVFTSGKADSKPKMKREDRDFRARSQSGDSSMLSKLVKQSLAVPGGGGVGVAKNSGTVDDADERIAVICTDADAKGGKYAHLNGHSDGGDLETDKADLHRTQDLEASCSVNMRRRSRSYEDILTASRDRSTPQPDEEAADFCLLSYPEPDDVDTGDTYDVIFDESEYLSDEDVAEDRSMEVRDLTPMDPLQMSEEGVDGARKSTPASITPPHGSALLINAFLQRLDSVMVNGIDYPPGLFFVQ